MIRMQVALIPAYEPGESLIDLVDELKENDFIVIVVNDGSGVEYDSVFSKLTKRAVVLNHNENRGKGAALRTGLSYIKTCFGQRCVVVTMDADGQHTVSDAKKVCNQALLSNNQLVLGVRGFDGEVPLRSKVGNYITRGIYRLFTGVNVKDTQTGLRAFCGNMIDEFLPIAGDRYEYEMNMLLECASKGIPIKEVDIETIYIGENETSHFNAFSDSVIIYKEIIKFSASSFLSFLIDYFVYVVLVFSLGNVVPYSILVANIGARLISGTFNFNVNRKAVFNSEESVLSEGVRYAALAVSILVLNTGLLHLLADVAGINAYFSKLVVECLLFFVSFVVQKKLVFCRRKGVTT